jgi:hypothetical protein
VFPARTAELPASRKTEFFPNPGRIIGVHCLIRITNCFGWEPWTQLGRGICIGAPHMLPSTDRYMTE